MQTINIHQVKKDLSKLLDEVNKGLEIIIVKSGKPIAKLTGLHPAKPVRKPGFLKGKIRIAKNFYAPLPHDVLYAFEGKS